MNHYIVFDWDGTLHNTKKLYAESVRKAYAFLVDKQCANLREFTDDELSKYLGMTAKEMWDDFMPELNPDIQSQAEQMVGQSMVDLVYAGRAKLYEGVPELLERLCNDGHKLIILSNCKIAYLDAHREVFELDRWFMDYYPAQQYDFIPKEEILKIIMSKYPGNYYMVGDRSNDIGAGIKCEVKTIGCEYGFGDRMELSNADYLVKDVKSIYDVISANLKQD